MAINIEIEGSFTFEINYADNSRRKWCLGDFIGNLDNFVKWIERQYPAIMISYDTADIVIKESAD